MRQEQLRKLKGFYFSLGGLSGDLENSVKLLNDYVSANCDSTPLKDTKVFPCTTNYRSKNPIRLLPKHCLANWN